MFELQEDGFNAPIKTWLPVEEIEPGALEQLRNAAKHPEVGPVVAVMPDCHVGYGCDDRLCFSYGESHNPQCGGGGYWLRDVRDQHGYQV